MEDGRGIRKKPDPSDKDASAALSLRLLRSTYDKKYASLEALLCLASATLLAEIEIKGCGGGLRQREGFWQFSQLIADTKKLSEKKKW